jgi:putative transposase
VIVHQAYRFALDPTAEQRRALQSHCGAARFVCNWGLREVKRTLDARRFEHQLLGGALTEPLSWTLPALRREWNRVKAEVAPWWAENSKEAYSSGLDALTRALQAWSQSRRGARLGERVGFPRFRRRGHRESCRFTTGAIRVDDHRHVTLPRLSQLRSCEPTSGLLERLEAGTARVLSATVSREADRWFVSFTCEVERTVLASNGYEDVVGVDLGVFALATLSTGERVAGPRPLRSSLRRLQWAQRVVSRRRTGSARRRRAIRRVARIHARVGALRRHHLHALTTRWAKSHGTVVVEDLNVRGMSRSAGGTLEAPGRDVRAKAGLSRSLADQSFGELRRMLEYKCRWYGSRLVVAPRFFPSSKRCSGCGVVRAELRVEERVFRCTACGLRLDRDLNAARNLVWWASVAKDVAGSAPETENARRGATAIRPPAGEGSAEARTGVVSEPTALSGGRSVAEVHPAPRMRTAILPLLWL